MEKSVDGTKIWLSRLPENDRRRTTAYETAYARWIPGDPWDALVALFAVGQDLETLREQVCHHIEECKEIRWVLSD